MQTSTPNKIDGATLNPALQDFWLKPARNKVLYGGRSSSKSWDAAGFAIFLASTCKVRFLCARQFQNKIAESVYTLLKIQIDRFGLRDEFKITDNKIVHKDTGSSFVFYGLWRHTEEIKSLEGIDVCWIEEAHALTPTQWDILEPTVRSEGSQFWIIFNPQLTTDFVYKRFITNTPPDTVVRKINYLENPFLSSTILKVIEAKREESDEDYRHIYLGEPLEDDDLSIIKRSWVNAAIDAHLALGIVPTGKKRIGFDVADTGEDKNASVLSYGILALDVQEWKGGEDELLKSAGRVHMQARVEDAEIDYDSIGVGAFAGSHFKALNKDHKSRIKYFKFNASGAIIKPEGKVDPNNTKSPLNKDYYCNLKAQTWWHVAGLFRNTFNAITKGMEYEDHELISISSDIEGIDDLIDELCTPRKDFDNVGRVKVESKKDLLDREVPSPNKADAFVMAFSPGKKHHKWDHL